jgi:UDP-N-acetylmuramoyl-L-alanyl-D-glutamate--2,6-diaminopimelate ligase
MQVPTDTADTAATAAIMSQLDALGVKRQRMTVDSRSIVAGDVFIAIPGSKVDGRDFIASALAQGATAVLREASGVTEKTEDSRLINVENLSSHLGEIADVFYDCPSSVVRVIGITGTNGKTSIANWLSQAFSALDMPCGAVGTLGVSLGATTWSTNNTTPDAAHVQTILRDLKDAGAVAVAMEVSSHALELHRVTGTRFDAVVFTNLTQDHLDFHRTMEAYGAAKAKLFTDYPVKHRIINADDEFGVQLIARKLPDTLSYGMDLGDVRGQVLAMSGDGMRLAISFAAQTVSVDTRLIGRFNAYNLLAVAATLIASDVSLARIATILSTLKAAPGRMQRVSTGSEAVEPSVYVDYAHTPDALAKALDTVRETRPRAVTVVFGCGGDRDRSKRPLMGKIAADRADHVYVTSDNPRGELPLAIIDEIVAGVRLDQRSALKPIVSRRDAIEHAIKTANAKDAILIAGKGHETYQEIKGIRHPFSDVDEALLALAARHLPMQKPNEACHVGR